MTERNRRFNNNIDPFTKVGNFDGEVTRIVGDGVVVDDGVESRVCPVHLEGGAVKVPSVEVDRVGVGDNDGVGDFSGFGADVERCGGDKACEGFVFTRSKNGTSGSELPGVGVRL